MIRSTPPVLSRLSVTSTRYLPTGPAFFANAARSRVRPSEFTSAGRPTTAACPSDVMAGAPPFQHGASARRDGGAARLRDRAELGREAGQVGRRGVEVSQDGSRLPRHGLEIHERGLELLEERRQALEGALDVGAAL